MHADRRHLSRFDVLVDGARLGSLAVATPSPSSSVVVHRLRDELGVERPAIVVRRRRLGGTLHEDVELWATGREPVTVTLVGRLRGGLRAPLRRQGRAGAGRRRTPTATLDGFEFRDPDGTATTTVRWDRTPDELDGGAGHVRWTLSAPPGQRSRVVDRRRARAGGARAMTRSPRRRRRPAGRPPPAGLGQSGAERHVDGWPVVRGRRSGPRRPRRAAHPGRRPSRPCRGRRRRAVVHDAVRPRLPPHVVDAPAVRPRARQRGPGDARRAAGQRRHDPIAEEEPGKILHEVRTLGGDGPFASRDRYFGSVDATPLFVATAAEAWRWGALDDAALATLAPAIERAVAWIRRHLRRPAVS